MLGLGGFCILFFQPRWLLAGFTRVNPGALFFVQTDQPFIALTIDDGPWEGTTSLILAVLAEYDAQATFFVIGDRLPGQQALLDRMIAEGHELGNHLSHDEASAKLSPSEFESDLLTTGAALAAHAQPRWLRPGMGWYTPQMIAIAQKHNYRVVLGDIFPYDTHIPSSVFAQQHILWNARPGSVIVLHDGINNRGQRTVATLRRILPQLQQRGYRIVTLSALAHAVILDN
ncbi:MAG: polysaccharide deacetylase family protein [Synechococcales cyanobacterium RU_4_20]|nr:polysaccharide deacetylase family protein [Synechococcales cyanobacterium RU_4_20]NJR69439.1 polysaccharide deacetylase family protein [Synechococcales cyanobacterium CRU_2_2]